MTESTHQPKLVDDVTLVSGRSFPSGLVQLCYNVARA
jgi:hypothetical protein